MRTWPCCASETTGFRLQGPGLPILSTLGPSPASVSTAGCGDIDPYTPCIRERLSTPCDEGYARSMMRGSTTLKNAVGLVCMHSNPLLYSVGLDTVGV